MLFFIRQRKKLQLRFQTDSRSPQCYSSRVPFWFGLPTKRVTYPFGIHRFARISLPFSPSLLSCRPRCFLAVLSLPSLALVLFLLFKWASIFLQSLYQVHFFSFGFCFYFIFILFVYCMFFCFVCFLCGFFVWVF
jgi:hypothetical protein